MNEDSFLARNSTSIATFLRAIPLFESLSPEQLERLSRTCKQGHYPPGSVILREGDIGHTFYVIESGHVEVRVKGAKVAGGDEAMGSSDAQQAQHGPVVHRSGPGDWFGERSLMTEQRRAATVLAASEEEVRCVVMDKGGFQKTLSTMNSLLDGRDTLNAALDAAAKQQVKSLSEHVAKFQEVRKMTKRLGNSGAVYGEPGGRRQEERYTSLLQELMLRLMAVFAPELTLDDIIERMVKVTMRFFSVERVGLFLVDLKAQPPTMVLKSAMMKQTQAEMVLPLQGIAGQIATSARPLREADVYNSAHFDPALDKKTRFRTRQIVGVPIFGQQTTPQGKREVIGVLELLNKQGAAAGVGFTEEDESLLESAAGQFAAALLQRKSELLAMAGTTVSAKGTRGRQGQQTMHCTPLYQLHTPFSVWIRQVRLPANSAVKDNAKLCVTIDLYHAGERLCEQLRTERVRARTLTRTQQQQLSSWQTQWQQQAGVKEQAQTSRLSASGGYGGYDHIGTPGGGSMHGDGSPASGSGADKVVVADFTGALAMAQLGGKQSSSTSTQGCTQGARLEAKGLVLRDLPRATKLVFHVYTGSGSNEINFKKPVGWAGCYLFDFERMMMSGVQRFSLFEGVECQSPNATTLENKPMTRRAVAAQMAAKSAEQHVSAPCSIALAYSSVPPQCVLPHSVCIATAPWHPTLTRTISLCVL
jgi:CRP-like cAMP-binding protein